MPKNRNYDTITVQHNNNTMKLTKNILKEFLQVNDLIDKNFAVPGTSSVFKLYDECGELMLDDGVVKYNLSAEVEDADHIGYEHEYRRFTTFSEHYSFMFWQV